MDGIAPDNLDEEIPQQMLDEFLGDVAERLDLIERSLPTQDSDSKSAEDSIHLARREANTIRGSASAFGFPTISLIAHRMEDYLQSISELSGQHVDATLDFIDRIRGIISKGEDPGEDAVRETVRALPYNAEFVPSDIVLRDVEVLLVAPSKTISQMATDQLAACGYRVTTARTPWEAFELAALIRPDMIITSAVMNPLGTADLARAFAAMSVTRDIPLGVLTSYAADHRTFRDLPRGAWIIRLTEEFSDDLAAMISDFETGPAGAAKA
ncbi:MAG: Hpt domain-containing protein [Alphaproteobacteria bacterium]|nr:Hpt domain-containing protein [Alphaproteobacteria bacterium]